MYLFGICLRSATRIKNDIRSCLHQALKSVKHINALWSIYTYIYPNFRNVTTRTWHLRLPSLFPTGRARTSRPPITSTHHQPTYQKYQARHTTELYLPRCRKVAGPRPVLQIAVNCQSSHRRRQQHRRRKYRWEKRHKVVASLSFSRSWPNTKCLNELSELLSDQNISKPRTSKVKRKSIKYFSLFKDVATTWQPKSVASVQLL